MKNKFIQYFFINNFFSFNLYGAASDQVSTEPDDFETSQLKMKFMIQ